MRELDQVVVEAILGWEEVLQAVAKITTDAPANYFDTPVFSERIWLSRAR